VSGQHHYCVQFGGRLEGEGGMGSNDLAVHHPQPDEPPHEDKGIGKMVKHYFSKMRGGVEKRPKRIPITQMIWSWIGTVIGITLVAVVHYDWVDEHSFIFIIGSFGASAVLIYGAPSSPLAQPRNLVGGHVVSAIVGVTVKLMFQGHVIELACGVAVAFAIVGMQLTITTHPPGGATALIAVTSPTYKWAGYSFVLVPVLSGSLMMLIVAVIVNNMSNKRRYPLFWW